MNTLTRNLGIVVGQSGRPFAGSVDTGLLVMRVGLGTMMMYHGLPKLAGGPDLWRRIGGAMGNLGINFAPEFWGLCAALAEGAGGLLIVLGLLFRPAAAGMIFTMIVASVMHVVTEKEFKGASHAVEIGLAILGLLLTGPGWFSLDRKILALSPKQPAGTPEREAASEPAGV